jgi:hypothetical protein
MIAKKSWRNSLSKHGQSKSRIFVQPPAFLCNLPFLCKAPGGRGRRCGDAYPVLWAIVRDASQA